MDKIYKYVFPDRVDVLENNRIRFTQPKYLNDPFDMHLSLRRLIPTKEFDGIFNAEKYYEKFISSFNDNLSKNNFPYSFEKMVEYQGKDIEEFKRELINGFDNITRLFTTENNFVKYYLNDELNKLMGVLSLTETPDNVPMWAHYAKVHQGFVLVFNARHIFFNGGFLADKDFGAIKKVTYPEEKIVLDSIKDLNSDQIFQKHKSWEYENEWRMILPLDKKIELKYPDIFLFEIPPDIITGIIFGYRCDEKLKSYVLNLRENKSDLQHLELFEAFPNFDNYKMNIIKVG